MGEFVLDLFHSLRCVDSEENQTKLLGDLSKPSSPTILSFVNTHAINLCYQNSEFQKSLCASDFLLRDGSGIRLALSLWNIPAGKNMVGTDFIPALLQQFKGKRLLLLGTHEPYLGQAAKFLQTSLGGAVQTLNGFQETSTYLELMLSFKPDLIILGMGMPRQENVSQMLKANLNFPMLLVNGGAIIDYLADRFPRAPLIIRQWGMEWIFRLALEPRRLWKRYLIGNGLFVARMLALKMRTVFK
jgi:exopolysaccharide biosynthesis WecB/TagA/CpsF family protein